MTDEKEFAALLSEYMRLLDELFAQRKLLSALEERVFERFGTDPKVFRDVAMEVRQKQIDLACEALIENNDLSAMIRAKETDS